MSEIERTLKRIAFTLGMIFGAMIVLIMVVSSK